MRNKKASEWTADSFSSIIKQQLPHIEARTALNSQWNKASRQVEVMWRRNTLFHSLKNPSPTHSRQGPGHAHKMDRQPQLTRGKVSNEAREALGSGSGQSTRLLLGDREGGVRRITLEASTTREKRGHRGGAGRGRGQVGGSAQQVPMVWGETSRGHTCGERNTARGHTRTGLWPWDSTATRGRPRTWRQHVWE